MWTCWSVGCCWRIQNSKILSLCCVSMLSFIFVQLPILLCPRPHPWSIWWRALNNSRFSSNLTLWCTCSTRTSPNKSNGIPSISWATLTKNYKIACEQHLWARIWSHWELAKHIMQWFWRKSGEFLNLIVISFFTTLSFVQFYVYALKFTHSFI